MSDREAMQRAVHERYAEAARAVTAGGEGRTRCGASYDGIGSSCYSESDLETLPPAAVAASIGCANPVAVAELAAGEVVLDLGSGGGIDVLLSARRVGDTGKAYGLDMTDEMLELARANQADAGIGNAEFIKGHMESIPLPDASVDVVLSNCVIALSVDKHAVLAEAYRVLRPGGRLAVADVVADTEPRHDELIDPDDWVACTGGALTEAQYRAALARAAFFDVSIDRSHPVKPGYTSVIVRASKPART